MVGLCTPDLQAKLAPAKQRLKDVSDETERKKKLKLDPAVEAETAPKKTQEQILTEINADPSLIADPSANPSGQYDLVAVLTHVGRQADSGHYIGWVKQNGSWCMNF
jgi:ubiquitin carboxyl-terminal hydrolase 14